MAYEHAVIDDPEGNMVTFAQDPQDELPAGVDCAGRPGTIVVTDSTISGRGDRFWDVTRSFYRAVGARFAFVREQQFQLQAGSQARRRWPEVGGRPFVRCPNQVH